MSQDHTDAGLIDLFGEVISIYTDEEALEDGFLVDLGTSVTFRGCPINWMTRHLFDDLEPFMETAAPLVDGDLKRALSSILRTKGNFRPRRSGQYGAAR